MTTTAKVLQFKDEPQKQSPKQPSPSWKVLIVDDEPGVHDVTVFALEDVRFENRSIEFLHAYSAAEARDVLESHGDVAVILLDVVMETDQAGLQFAKQLREELNNPFSRVILRTGQPGQAPERQVILDYDINDYREKTELSSKKLFTAVITALRSYRDITALDKNGRGLEHVIVSSGALYQTQSREQFMSSILSQLGTLLNLGGDAFYSRGFGFAGDERDRVEDQRIVAGTGDFESAANRRLKEVVDAATLDAIDEACRTRRCVYRGNKVVIDLQARDGCDGIIFFDGCRRQLDDVDKRLIEIFTSHSSMALNNLYLNQELEFGQRELMFSLGEIAEFRSRETSRHVARMSKIAERLAWLHGMDEEECNLVLLAATMHDVGKIAIPDAILHKSGPLSDHEWVVMQSHCIWGEHLLKGSKRPLLRAASIIASQHHEKWDGSGYPNHLAGEEIHLYGRIAALADVFDALCNKRCYKEAWTLDEVRRYIEDQRGRHFDPTLTDHFLDNFELFVEVREAYHD
jgi:response regulator RpfG family c-di-GMP phosphodiesterase